MVLSFVSQTPCRTSETNMWSVKNKTAHNRPQRIRRCAPTKRPANDRVELLHSQIVCWSNRTILGYLLHWSLDPLNPTTQWGISLSYSAWLSVSYLQVRSVKAAFASLSVNCIWDVCLLQFSWSDFWLNRLYCNPATMGGTIQCTLRWQLILVC